MKNRRKSRVRTNLVPVQFIFYEVHILATEIYLHVDSIRTWTNVNNGISSVSKFINNNPTYTLVIKGASYSELPCSKV